MKNLIKNGNEYELLLDSYNPNSNGCFGCAFNPTPDCSVCDCSNIENSDCVNYSGTWKLIKQKNE